MRKPLCTIVLITLLYCCSAPVKEPPKQDGPGDGWILYDSAVSINKYTKKGLLDTVFSTSYHYYKNTLLVKFMSCTVCAYDSSNREINEKRFDIDSGVFKMAGEMVYRYDRNNNVACFINKVNGEITDEDSSEYNNAGLCIKRISVSSMPQGLRAAKDPGKAAGKVPKYDTTISTYFYDAGYLHKIEQRYPNKKIKTVQVNEYSGEHLLLQTITRNSLGKPTRTSFFIYTDSLTKEIIDSPEFFTSDTAWKQGNKYLKEVSNNFKERIQHLTMFNYDKMGNLIKAASYKRATPVTSF